eukprot:scaffold9736_cov30-Prasinocladus_malaysianus.AAC.1
MGDNFMQNDQCNLSYNASHNKVMNTAHDWRVLPTGNALGDEEISNRQASITKMAHKGMPQDSGPNLQNEHPLCFITFLDKSLT